MPAANKPQHRTIVVAHPSAELYGSDRVLLESLSGLVADDWSVILTVPVDGPLIIAARDRGVDVRISRTLVIRKSILTIRGFVLAVADGAVGLVKNALLLRTTRADVVYVNTTTLPLWVAVAKFSRRQVILHVHEAEKSAAAPLRFLLALPSLVADRIISNSNFSTDALRSSIPGYRKNIELVHNAVPGPEQPSLPREHLTSDLHLIYVGRLSARKGVDVAIEAMARVEQSGRRCRLTLLGTVYPGYEWYEEELKELIRARGLSDRIFFAGFDKSVWKHFADADIALIPSRLDEPFGNTAVEASLAQRPAVISDTSGLREAAGAARGSILVRPGDPEALARGITVISDQWERYRSDVLIDAAAARVRHDPALYQRRISTLVREVLDDD